MKSPVLLRQVDASALSELLPLFRAYQAHYSTLTRATEEMTAAFLRELMSTPSEGFVVLAESEGKAVGFATAYFTVSGLIAAKLLHVGDLYVAPEYRRKGIATLLMDEVAHMAENRGIELVRWLSVASNEDLNRWYASLGASSGDFKLFLRPSKARAVSKS